MSSQLLEQAFGCSKNVDKLDLYSDVLHVNKDCTLAQLRKAYYKQALKYHPDKNSTEEAKMKFQAISWVYNVLKDPTKRSDYDNEGIIPFDDDDNNDSDNDENEHTQNSWKNYFDLIFGKIQTSDIDNFAMKYKMSEEEEKDVLENYVKFKGNLIKMLEYVMLSEERDVPRWVEDYIQPAIDSKNLTNEYTKKMNSTLQKIKKKLEKEQEEDDDEVGEEEMDVEAEVEVEADVDVDQHQKQEKDDDETETEESSGGGGDEEEEEMKSKKKKPPVATTTKNVKKSSSSSAAAAAKKKKKPPPPKKGKPTKAKKKKKESSSSQADLIAAIRNKSGRGNPLAAIGARYGVSMDSDDDEDDNNNDPLNDAEFEKIQARLNKNKKKRKK